MTNEEEDRLAVIRNREQAATKGPWYFHYDHEKGAEIIAYGNQDNGPHHEVMVPVAHEGGADIELCWRHADASFTANARSDVPWLLDLIETLRRSS